MLVNLFLFSLTLVSAHTFHAKRGCQRLTPTRNLALGASDGARDSFSEQQFDMFKKNNVGHWKGLQTGYDPQDDEVEDYMYTEVTYTNDDETGELKQKNGYVVGEIRADCEVCFDSERLKEKEVGSFGPEKNKMRGIRTVHNVDLRGPAPTPRGLSLEASIRHGDGKLRVLFAYTPLDFADFLGLGQVPVAMGLTDVIVIRERENRRPLKLEDSDGGFDVMWRASSIQDFQQFERLGNVRSGVYHRFDEGVVQQEGGSVVENIGGVSDEITVQPLPNALMDGSALGSSSTSPSFHHHHTEGQGEGEKEKVEEDEEDANTLYRRVFPGGVQVESLAVLMPGIPTKARISWVPCPEENVLYTVDLSFSALEPAKEQGGDVVRMKPPSLLGFDVKDFVTAKKF